MIDIPKYVEINIGGLYIIRLYRNRWGQYELPDGSRHAETIQKDLDVLFPRDISKKPD